MSKRSRVHPKYKTKYRVRNWREYEAALVRRGDISIWLHPNAIRTWTPRPLGVPGRPRSYSELAVDTALTLRLVFGLPWRQTEGLLRSLLRLMHLPLPTPDHTTLSRRARSSAVRAPSRASDSIHLVVDATGLKVDVETRRPFRPRLEEAAPGRRPERLHRCRRHYRRLRPRWGGGPRSPGATGKPTAQLHRRRCLRRASGLRSRARGRTCAPHRRTAIEDRDRLW